MRMTDLRVILWDIDGTLLHSRRHGAFREYMRPALVRVFGTAGRLDVLVVSGMTDLQIFTAALEGEGYTAEQIRGRLPELIELFLGGMERMAAEGELFQELPGARAALEKGVEASYRFGHVGMAQELEARRDELGDA